MPFRMLLLGMAIGIFLSLCVLKTNVKGRSTAPSPYVTSSN